MLLLAALFFIAAKAETEKTREDKRGPLGLAMSGWLLAALVASLLAASATACEDLSGRWKIGHFVESGSLKMVWPK